MKKLVFAAQVFGLSAMLPIIAFLELNHGASNSSVSGIGKPGAIFHSKINAKKANDAVATSQETFVLKTF